MDTDVPSQQLPPVENIEIIRRPLHVYNERACPQCNGYLFGMPGGRDAVCRSCGFKEPCCGD